MPYRIPAMANTPFGPTNCTEAAMFQSQFCDQCVKDEAFRNNSGDGCATWSDAFFKSIADHDYPSHLTHDDEGRPTCTAFMPLSDSAA